MPEQIQPPDDRLIEAARALIEPHYSRLHREHAALLREGHHRGDLVVEVPARWPKDFDTGSTLFGMDIRRAEIDEPRVVAVRPLGPVLSSAFRQGDHNQGEGREGRVWKIGAEDFARMKADLERPLARRAYWRMSPDQRDEFDGSARSVGLSTDEAIEHVARVKAARGEVSS